MSKHFEDITQFEIIFKEYFNPLVNFVNKYLNNFENSREVVQSVFAKIWENRLNLDIKISVKSYIYQMTKNVMIDYIRKNKHYINAQEIKNSVIEELADHQESVLDPYIIRQAIESALKDVKPKAREIFELNKFEGLTYEEIADYLNISKRSVEDNVSKIVKKLNDALKNHPDFFE